MLDSPEFCIRSYREGDLPSLRAMLNGLQEYECTLEPNRAHWADGGAAYTEGVLKESAQNVGAVLIAESEPGIVIGVLTCWRIEDTTDLTVVPEARAQIYISELFVAPSWRGRNVAAALLAGAEEHARSLGIAQLTIGSLAGNAAARRAYAKAGFAEYELLLRKRL